jgi:hypothetical protein
VNHKFYLFMSVYDLVKNMDLTIATVSELSFFRFFFVDDKD